MKTQHLQIDDVAKEVGHAVRREREKLDLTQLELANFAGCGITFINQLEQGKVTVRLDKLLRVLNALGMTLTISKGKQAIEVKAQ